MSDDEFHLRIGELRVVAVKRAEKPDALGFSVHPGYTGYTEILTRYQVVELWRNLESWVMKGEVRPQPECTYTAVICEGCGVARLELDTGSIAVSGSRNYPPCGCGGQTFEQRKLVARRKMVVKWEGQ